MTSFLDVEQQIEDLLAMARIAHQQAWISAGAGIYVEVGTGAALDSLLAWYGWTSVLRQLMR